MRTGPTEAEIIEEDEKDAAREAAGAAQIARVALIVAAMAFALSVLGLFLPIR